MTKKIIFSKHHMENTLADPLDNVEKKDEITSAQLQEQLSQLSALAFSSDASLADACSSTQKNISEILSAITNNLTEEIKKNELLYNQQTLVITNINTHHPYPDFENNEGVTPAINNDNTGKNPPGFFSKLKTILKTPLAKIIYRIAAFGGIVHAASEGFNGTSLSLSYTGSPLIVSLIISTVFAALSVLLYLGFDYLIVKKVFGAENNVTDFKSGIDELLQQQEELKKIYQLLIRYLIIIKKVLMQSQPLTEEHFANILADVHGYLDVIKLFDNYLQKMCNKLENIINNPGWKLNTLCYLAFAAGFVLFSANGFFDGSMLVMGLILSFGSFPGSTIVIVAIGLFAALARAIVYCCAEGPGVYNTITTFFKLPIEKIADLQNYSSKENICTINELLQDLKHYQQINAQHNAAIAKLAHEKNLILFEKSQLSKAVTPLVDNQPTPVCAAKFFKDLSSLPQILSESSDNTMRPHSISSS